MENARIILVAFGVPIFTGTFVYILVLKTAYYILLMGFNISKVTDNTFLKVNKV